MKIESILSAHGFGGTNPEGDAVEADVLSGKTFSNENDVGLVGTMPNRGRQIITPGTSNIVIPDGYHNGTGYVVGDADLISANIKAGANIFGVAGKTEVVDTTESSAPAAADNILSGKVAFVNGSKLTGSMTNRGAYNITPGSTNKTIPRGYHSGAGVVYGDANLVASNIRSGKTIFGVAGSLIPGAAISSVQRGEAIIRTGETITISSVDLSKSVIILSGIESSSTDNEAVLVNVMAEFVSSNQISITRVFDGDAVTVRWQVLTFSTGVSVQHVSGALSSGTYNNLTINAVDVNKSVVFLTQKINGDIINSYLRLVVCVAFLYSSTVLRVERGHSNSNHYLYFSAHILTFI